MIQRTTRSQVTLQLREMKRQVRIALKKGYYATGEGGLDIGHAERECARAGLVKVFRYLSDWYDGPKDGCPVCGKGEE